MTDYSSQDESSNCCCEPPPSISKKRKNLHVYIPIEWRSDVIPPPPPPPPPSDKAIKNKPNLTIVLANGTSMVKVSQMCSSTYDYYEYKLTKLDDFLALAEYYENHLNHKKRSNIDFPLISKLAPHLYELNSLVGMEQVKEQIVSLVLFFIQKLDNINYDMLHSVIYGSPGVGKTRLIYILANIFACLGITQTAKVTFVKRADLIGQYLGQTAVKTKKVLEDACGGVLVIDEAYSLGDTEQRDSFSRECIDTLNQYLSECRRDLICIIAGYKDDLESRFFKTNAGLKRRFAFQYTIPDYTPEQLREIFIQTVKSCEWNIEDGTASIQFFEENHHHFEHNGGDMELLFAKIKFEHARRVFSGRPADRKIITRQDMEAGMEKFLENIVKKKEDAPPPMMYT